MYWCKTWPSKKSSEYLKCFTACIQRKKGGDILLVFRHLSTNNFCPRVHLFSKIFFWEQLKVFWYSFTIRTIIRAIILPLQLAKGVCLRHMSTLMWVVQFFNFQFLPSVRNHKRNRLKLFYFSKVQYLAHPSNTCLTRFAYVPVETTKVFDWRRLLAFLGSRNRLFRIPIINFAYSSLERDKPTVSEES